VNRIRELRKAQNLTLKQLAEKMSADGGSPVHFTTIGKMERGEMRVTMEWLMRAAQALSVSLFEIVAKREPGRTIPLILLPAGKSKSEESFIVTYVNPTPWSDDAFFLVASHVEGVQNLLSFDLDPTQLLLVDPSVTELVAGKLYVIMTQDGIHRLRTFKETPPRFVAVGNTDEDTPILLGIDQIEVVGAADLSYIRFIRNG